MIDLSVEAQDLAEDPIIVFGAPRSGTTFLRAILSEHPNVFVSMETRVFRWAYQTMEVLPADERYVGYHRDEFLEALRPWMRWFLRDYYRRIGGGAFWWGDKYPHYAEQPKYLESIQDLFPGARFINVIRDGRDVVASLLRKGWVDFNECHEVWLTHVQFGRDFSRSLPAGQYFELRYEDLVLDGLAKTREIFSFLGIEMHPDVVAFCESQARQRTPVGEPTREFDAIERLGSDWKALLTPEQQRASLALLTEDLETLGYAIHPAGAPASDVPGLRANTTSRSMSSPMTSGRRHS